jgi:hypothetical protein
VFIVASRVSTKKKFLVASEVVNEFPFASVVATKFFLLANEVATEFL